MEEPTKAPEKGPLTLTNGRSHVSAFCGRETVADLKHGCGIFDILLIER